LIPIFARIRRLEDSHDVETVVQKGNKLYQEINWTLTRIEDRPAKFQLHAEDFIDPSTTEEYGLLSKSYRHHCPSRNRRYSDKCRSNWLGNTDNASTMSKAKTRQLLRPLTS